METSKPRRPSRVPPAVAGIQVNYCRNINCPNFGVIPGEGDRRNKAETKGQPDYVMTGALAR